MRGFPNVRVEQRRVAGRAGSDRGAFLVGGWTVMFCPGEALIFRGRANKDGKFKVAPGEEEARAVSRVLWRDDEKVEFAVNDKNVGAVRG